MSIQNFLQRHKGSSRLKIKLIFHMSVFLYSTQNTSPVLNAEEPRCTIDDQLTLVLPVPSTPTSNPPHRTNKMFLRSKPNNYNCILIGKAPCNSSSCSFTMKSLKSPKFQTFAKILAAITCLHMENISYFFHSVCQKILFEERKFQQLINPLVQISEEQHLNKCVK